MKTKPLIYEDGGDWQVFDLRRDGCAVLPVVARSKFKATCHYDELHVHKGFAELFLCMKGCVRYETEAGEEQMLPGQVFASRPDQPHCRISSPKGMCLYRAIVAVPPPPDIFGLPPDESRFLMTPFMTFDRRVSNASSMVKPAFERLFSVCRKERRGVPARRLAVKSAALDLLLALGETLSVRQCQKKFSSPKVEAIVERIARNPVADYPVPMLAYEAGMSTVALNSAFKRLTGLTPHAYVLDARVRRARKDLERGEAISAVAAKYNFPSAAHFATMFRRIIGHSPRHCQ